MSDSASTSAGKMTPVPTSSGTDISWDDKQSITSAYGDIGTVPWPGNIYMIRHRGLGTVITLGRKGLVLDNISKYGGWHWHCSEKDGWLGFCNVVSLNYLGRNGNRQIIAQVPHHKSYEYFVARAHPGGGFELLTLHDWKFVRVGVKDEQTLIETENEDEVAIWDFVKIDDDRT